MAYFQRRNDFDPASSSESEEIHSNDESHHATSHGSVAFGNLLRVRSSPQFIQDTEENVGMQTEDVFVNYMYQSYHLQIEDRDDSSSLPSAQDFLNISRNPLTPAAEVGRRLASLGDNLSERYSDELDGMVSSLCDDDDAYEAFANIARRVFSGGIKWHRILILLNFGYRMAVAKLMHAPSAFSTFLKRIVSFMVRFIVTERIANWIAQQGGWVAAINVIPEHSSSTFYVVSGLAALTVLAVIISHKFF